jgi:hypothetical protein
MVFRQSRQHGRDEKRVFNLLRSSRYADPGRVATKLCLALQYGSTASMSDLARSHPLSTGRPIFGLVIRNSHMRLVSLSTRWESDVSVSLGLSRFSRIFLPLSSLIHAWADERQCRLARQIHTETRKTFHRSNWSGHDDRSAIVDSANLFVW